MTLLDSTEKIKNFRQRAHQLSHQASSLDNTSSLSQLPSPDASTWALCIPSPHTPESLFSPPPEPGASQLPPLPHLSCPISRFHLFSQANTLTASLILLSPTQRTLILLKCLSPPINSITSLRFPQLHSSSHFYCDLQIFMPLSCAYSRCLAEGWSIYSICLTYPLSQERVIYILHSKAHRARITSPQQNPGMMSQGHDFCHLYEILLILDFWVKKIRGECYPL